MSSGTTFATPSTVMCSSCALTRLLRATTRPASSRAGSRRVQHKLSVDNIRSSIKQLNTLKPDSARYATFRVPKDVAAEATRLAGSDARVQASEFSRADVHQQLDRGADQLARYGSWSTNRFFQTAKAGGQAAAGAVLIGGAIDLLPLLRGHITTEHFAARRGIDALEGASTAVVTSGLVVATTSGATALVAAGGTGAVTALAVLTAPTWIVPAAAGVIAGVGVRFAARPIRKRIDRRYREGAGKSECVTNG